jgi:hypothetical protein
VLAILTIIGVSLLIFGLSLWLLLAIVIFVGAVTMADMHDDYPPKDFIDERIK